MCDVGGLSGVHKKTKVRGHPYVEGATADKYFCGGDQFTSREATVFCRMLGWSSGRSSVTSTDLSLSEETLSVQCQGETTQCNVCLKYWHTLCYRTRESSVGLSTVEQYLWWSPGHCDLWSRLPSDNETSSGHCARHDAWYSRGQDRISCHRHYW